MENELISIIVPIYNAEEYLPDCLDSIVRQTYKNVEILLVENGSSDKSLEICKQYASRYPGIRLLQEGVRQQGSARNRGLKELRGDYYCFVDADDYVSDRYVERMYRTAKKYEADLVVCGVVYMLECRDVTKDVTHIDRKEDDPDKLRRSVWGKLYRSSLYKDVRFTDQRMASDVVYSGEIYAISSNAAICGDRLYGYRSYQGSVTRIVPNKKFFLKLDSFIRDNNEAEIHHLIEKCIQVVSQRHEEQLYHKELKMLWNRIDKMPELEGSVTSKLRYMIESTDVTPVRLLYLKLKHFFTSFIAFIRKKTNYHCQLD